MHPRTYWILAGTALAVLTSTLHAQAAGYQHIRQKMNYQGLLANASGTPYTGTRNLTFRIYDQVSGGSALWTETQSSVSVANGVFNVVLGGTTAINLPFRKEYWLEIQVETETMTPRHLLSNASYAMASRKVVYQQVITVAQDGGDTCTVYGALQMIAAESPTPSSTDQWVIEVQAGTFTETNSITLPDYVSLRGQGWNATSLTFSSGSSLSLGNYCGVEGLTLNLSGSTGYITIFNVTNSHIRNCYITTNLASPYAVSLQSAIKCDFSNNKLVAQNCGGLYVMFMQSSQDTMVIDNYIDFTQNSGVSGLNANNITRCAVLRNVFYYEGATDATYGIYINNNSSSGRISFNVLYGDATTPNARDITTSNSTPTYPVRPTHTGPYGICNQGSDGSELPAF